MFVYANIINIQGLVSSLNLFFQFKLKTIIICFQNLKMLTGARHLIWKYDVYIYQDQREGLPLYF